MKAAQFYNNHDIRIEDVPEPIPGEGQVVVDVEWCGICGSDLHEYLLGPLTTTTTPTTLGHELCGRVRNPPSTSKFHDGDPVIIDPRILCKTCPACKSGSTAACYNLGYIGGGGGTRFGGFGEKVVVEEESVHKLPEQIGLEDAAVLEPLVIVNHAVKVSGVKRGEWGEKSVLVVGGGPIGFGVLLILRAMGAGKVFVSEPAEMRRRQVREFCGEEGVINPLEEDVATRVKEQTVEKRGVDVVFDCAGVKAGLDSAMEALRFEGLYVMVAGWETPMTVPCFTFLHKHITMKGSLIFGDGDLEEVMEMIVKGELKGYEKMITGRIALEEIVEKGFRELIENKDEHVKILVRPR
ncbi:uncharacterized protein MYCFIDRAFT_193622 [Pseudocercospora fijiensis CIRAD86]|uniref:Enoyl reductase (ER) domain-containing protein n=1 Tax=Pseudocercospora fijiensis (strain CIRAD86) TaxID=383855 RepID=M3B7I8_PSEFD|nr:uncharacterized protein MYCFIDRAFT_193622 [Pseudocercospora fijiensis CIRAD86]EME85267.1 hypothetical protein MYCFIDRAFT_193622 [Pseudocercospora fijiensis CIRAD86]